MRAKVDDDKILSLVSKTPSQYTAKSRTLLRRKEYHCLRDATINMNTEDYNKPVV